MKIKMQDLKIKSVIFLLLAAMLVFAGCGEEEEIVSQVSAEEVKKVLDDGAVFIIIDVTTEEEYEKAHIPGAVRVTKSDLEELVKEGLHKDEVIVVYSRDVADSNDCAELLLSLEYKYVYNLGTLKNWKYDTEKGDGA